MEESRNPLMIYRVNGIYEVTLLRARLNEEPLLRTIRKRVEILVSDHPKAKVLLDFREVEYLTSAMLGVLAGLCNLARVAGGKIRLCSLRPEIKQVFTITGLDRMMEIFPTRKEGAAAFALECVGRGAA